MATNTPSMHSGHINHIRGNNQKFNIDLRFMSVFSLIGNAKGVGDRGAGGWGDRGTERQGDRSF
jgi:hypothetical protein